MSTASSKDLIHEYNRVIADLTNVITNEQLPLVLGVLERVPDEGADLRQQFETGQLRMLSDVHTWMEHLRLLRLLVHLRAVLGEQYDLFVQAYQQLSANAEAGEDERKLLNEIGDFMYRIDELSGEYERLSIRLITELSKSLKLTYGILHEPRDDLHAQEVHEDHARRIDPMISEVVELGRGMIDLERVMIALVRMRKLMLKF